MVSSSLLYSRAMQGEKKERWLELCEQASVEQDGQKLLELVKQIDDLLEEKERRLGVLPPTKVDSRPLQRRSEPGMP